ncbi:hypothetical protein V1478_012680 [Vespula squamosa]|uniref:Uncharacterized protein n=1 Tax=Vespula squamosa TaxID=30214 RepID=A0ABD2AAX4_VESSQ
MIFHYLIKCDLNHEILMRYFLFIPIINKHRIISNIAIIRKSELYHRILLRRGYADIAHFKVCASLILTSAGSRSKAVPLI